MSWWIRTPAVVLSSDYIKVALAKHFMTPTSQPAIHTWGLVCLRLPLQPSETWLLLAFAHNTDPHKFHVAKSKAPRNFQARQKVHLLCKQSLSLAQDKICQRENNKNDMRSLKAKFSAFALKPGLFGFHMNVRIVPIVLVISNNVQTIGTIIWKRYQDDRKLTGPLRRPRLPG